MDIARQFRCLVIENSVTDHSICDQYFAFKTVFYIRGSSYCCCRCAYDHEYFTYISDTGEIDLKRFDKLAKAVESGYCEHALKVENKEYLKETSVHSIHVAAALGLENKVKAAVMTLGETKLRYPQYCKGTIFNLTPCDIGCLKHNIIILHYVDKIDIDKMILNAKESVDGVLHIEETSVVNVCFQENDIEALRALLNVAKENTTIYFELLFKFSLKNKLKDFLESKNIIKAVLKIDDINLDMPPSYEIDSNVAMYVMSIGELAIIYNQCDVFKYLMHRFLNYKDHPRKCYTKVKKLQHTLILLCIAFKRTEFEENIDTREIYVKMSDSFKLECLFRLLVKYKLSRDLVKKAMEQIPDLLNTINDRNDGGLTLLQSYCFENTVEVSIVQTLIDLGANIDVPMTCTPLEYNISNMLPSLLIYIFRYGFKEVAELLLYENISLANNKSVVSDAIKEYTAGEIAQNDPSIQPGTIIMDATLHEDIFTSLIPLFIAAGFKYSLSDMEDALELFKDSSYIDKSLAYSEDPVENNIALMSRQTLSNHEHTFTQSPVEAYLQRCLSEPRSLMLQCRDVLRNHFPRRQIHRYVSVMDIPNRIRDFLLLKPILRRLPADIYSESYNRHELTSQPLSDNQHKHKDKRSKAKCQIV